MSVSDVEINIYFSICSNYIFKDFDTHNVYLGCWNVHMYVYLKL